MYTITFVSNLLQLVVAKSIIETENNFSRLKNIVVISNNTIDEKTVRTIKTSSELMSFDKVYLFRRQKISNFKLFKKIRNIQTFEKQIIKDLGGILDNSSKVYVRSNIGKDERHIIRLLNLQNKVVLIDDGFATYNIFTSEVKRFTKIKNNLINYLKLLLTLLITRDFHFSLRISFQNNKIKNIDRENFLLNENNLTLKNKFKNNIYLIANNLIDKNNQEYEVIIIGTLYISDPEMRRDLDIDAEIKFYNKLINNISKKYKIANDKILYKHHPRISYQNWNKKKSELQCSMLELEYPYSSEVFFCNDKIQAVYSCYSSSIIYANEIFSIPTFIVKPSSLINNFHLSAYYDWLKFINLKNYPTIDI